MNITVLFSHSPALSSVLPIRHWDILIEFLQFMLMRRTLGFVIIPLYLIGSYKLLRFCYVLFALDFNISPIIKTVRAFYAQSNKGKSDEFRIICLLD